MLDVVALGAIVESEDLTGPPRHPNLDEGGYVLPPPLEDPRSERHGSSGYYFTEISPEMMMAERRKMLESGMFEFYAEEFADLSDGRRVILKDDRGWSDSLAKVANGCSLTFDAATILQPDYSEYWMKWVVERLDFLGVNVDPVSVHAAPFKVEFGPRVQRDLRQRKPSRQLSKLNVVALGAIVETEDLNASPRWPVLYGGYCVHHPAPGELGTSRPLPRRGPHPQGLLAERQRMLESGRPQFYAEEFADLSDGRRVILKDDRGWSHWPVNSPDSSWKVADGHALTIETILMLDPGDDELWMEWVVERLCFFGVDVDPASVHAAPFWVEFGPRVQRELRLRKSGR